MATPTTPPTPPAPTTPPPGAVAIPLTPAVRAAYQTLYDTNEALLEATNDLALVEPLNDIRTNVGSILNKDDEYRLVANTTSFEALDSQIKSTNASLTTLKAQIKTVVSRVALAGTVVGAIDKVIGLVGI